MNRDTNTGMSRLGLVKGLLADFVGCGVSPAAGEVKLGMGVGLTTWVTVIESN
jgi:hypothetical protein